MSVTFAVSDVKPIELQEWHEARPLAEVLPLLLGKGGDPGWTDSSGPNPTVEAFGGPAMLLPNAMSPKQGLFDAAALAYSNHLPLTLSPDHIWLTIAQGFARHVSQNAKELYPQLIVGATGEIQKQKLEVRRDLFVKGSPTNDWPGVFEEFSQLLRAKAVPKTYERLICDFSTTGLLEKAISNLTLMDTLASYFSYEVHTMCGIPQITLTGTPEDWRKVRAKASMLAEYGLSWWTEVLLPVLDHFVAAAEGNADPEWWKDFFKENGRSGGPIISGVINAFFPFVKQREYKTKTFTDTFVPRNKLALGKDPRSGKSPSPWRWIHATAVPTGFVTVPFEWNYLTKTFPMQFIGGLVGVSKDNVGVTPEAVWAVCAGAK